MRKDKDLAFSLRKQGKTYKEIEKELGVSRGTLSSWFKGFEWSKNLSNSNTQNNLKLSTERIKNLNEGRRKALEIKYKKNEIESVVEYEIFKKQPLFMAGLMLYAGEGDKRSKNNSRISNSDFYLHEVFIQFSEKFLKIKRENIKIGLILYPDLDQSVCVGKWSKILKVDEKNFYKTQVIQGKTSNQNNKLQYGVGISIISSTVVIKKKILKWLEMCAKDFLEDAAMV